MSALAKKMLEKYGWKEGDGLGKDKTGMKSFVKVVRRDPKVATGLGHAADPSHGGSLASTHAVELDAIYGQFRRPSKQSRASSDSSEEKEEREEESQPVSASSSSSHSSSDSDEGEGKGKNRLGRAQINAATRRTRKQNSDSESSEEEEEDAQGIKKRRRTETVGDVTRMSDQDLFARCGGVRLGRAGRHRYFDGKLKRIDDTS